MVYQRDRGQRPSISAPSSISLATKDGLVHISASSRRTRVAKDDRRGQGRRQGLKVKLLGLRRPRQGAAQHARGRSADRRGDGRAGARARLRAAPPRSAPGRHGRGGSVLPNFRDGKTDAKSAFDLDCDFPAVDMGPWPAGFTVGREQIYDDAGRLTGGPVEQEDERRRGVRRHQYSRSGPPRASGAGARALGAARFALYSWRAPGRGAPPAGAGA